MNIDQDTMRIAMAKTILETIDKNTREELLTNAIKHLIQPQEKGYGRPGKSPLELAFIDQLSHAAHAMIREKLNEEGDMRDRLRGAVARVMDRALFEDDVLESIADKVAEGIKSAVRGY